MEMHTKDSFLAIHGVDLGDGSRKDVLRGIWKRLVKTYQAAAEYHQACRDYEELTQLSDHQLKDIGLERRELSQYKPRFFK